MDYGYNINGVIKCIEITNTLFPDSDLLFVHRKRKFRIFHEIGTRCVKCSLKSTHILKWHEEENPSVIHYDYVGRNHSTYGFILMTFDHIIPKSKDGSNKAYNLQPMCYRCNKEKEDMPNDQFMVN
jgi:hypothetical protein